MTEARQIHEKVIGKLLSLDRALLPLMDDLTDEMRAKARELLQEFRRTQAPKAFPARMLAPEDDRPSR